jgi:hypothetical protein
VQVHRIEKDFASARKSQFHHIMQRFDSCIRAKCASTIAPRDIAVAVRSETDQILEQKNKYDPLRPVSNRAVMPIMITAYCIATSGATADCQTYARLRQGGLR